MTEYEKKIVAKVASWVSDNVEISDGAPLIFGLDTPEQKLLETYLGFERLLKNNTENV